MKKYISSTFEIGQIVMIEEEGSLTNLFIPGENRTSAKRQKENAVEEETPVLRKAKEELREYFSGKRLKERRFSNWFGTLCWRFPMEKLGPIGRLLKRPEILRRAGR